MTSLRIFLTLLAEVLTLDCVKSFIAPDTLKKKVISCVTIRKMGGIHSNNGGDFGESVGKNLLLFFSRFSNVLKSK